MIKGNRSDLQAIDCWKKRYYAEVTESYPFLEFWIKEKIDCYYWAIPYAQLNGHIDHMRRENQVPYIFETRFREDPNMTLTHWRNDSGRSKWILEYDLRAAQLVDFSTQATDKKLWVSILIGYQDLVGNLTYTAAAFENPSNLDWEFKSDMSAAD